MDFQELTTHTHGNREYTGIICTMYSPHVVGVEGMLTCLSVFLSQPYQLVIRSERPSLVGRGTTTATTCGCGKWACQYVGVASGCVNAMQIYLRTINYGMN